MSDTFAARIPDDMMPDTPWDVMPDTPWDDDEPDADYVRRCESTVHTDPPLRCEQAVNHEGVHRIDSEPDRTVTWLVEGELAIGSPDFWPLVAAQIFAPYTYDLSDRSHLLDVVQIVCEAADDVLKKARVKR